MPIARAAAAIAIAACMTRAMTWPASSSGSFGRMDMDWLLQRLGERHGDGGRRAGDSHGLLKGHQREQYGSGDGSEVGNSLGHCRSPIWLMSIIDKAP